MMFTKAVLFAAAVVSASARGPRLFQDEAEAPAHPHKGRWMCNLISFQNPDVTVEECMDIASQIRTDCEAALTEEADRHEIRSCVGETMHSKFDFVSLYDMEAEQRTEFVAQECAATDEDGALIHDDAAECEERFTATIEECIDEAEDNGSFRHCMRRAVRAAHGGPPPPRDGDEQPPQDGEQPPQTGDDRPPRGPRGGRGRGRGPHGGPHGGPHSSSSSSSGSSSSEESSEVSSEEGGRPPRGGGRRHGGRPPMDGGERPRGGRHGGPPPSDSADEPIPVDSAIGGVSIFPGEEIEQHPAVEKPYFGDEDSTVAAAPPGDMPPRRQHSGGMRSDPRPDAVGRRHAALEQVKDMLSESEPGRFRGAKNRAGRRNQMYNKRRD